MGKATRNRKFTLVRRLVQVGALVLFCLPLLVAGWGLFGAFVGTDAEVATPAAGVFFGSLSSSCIFGIDVLDPFAMLQVAAASKSFDASWLVAALPVLLVYGLVRGRAFCGWVCPVNLFCELLDMLRRRLGLKVPERVLPRRTKIGVAAGVLVLSALLSIPVFEAVSPVSAINKLLLFGSLAGMVTLVAIVLVELFWGRRVWCRALCPLGGFYQVLGRVGLLNVRIDHDACTHCGACERACLVDPQVLEGVLSGRDVMVRAGDCMACGACVDACPTAALKLCPGRPKASERKKDS